MNRDSHHLSLLNELSNREMSKYSFPELTKKIKMRFLRKHKRRFIREHSCMLFCSIILGVSSPRRNFSSDSFNAAFILSCFAFSSASFFRLLFSVFEIFWSSFLFSSVLFCVWVSSEGSSWLEQRVKYGQDWEIKP